MRSNDRNDCDNLGNVVPGFSGVRTARRLSPFDHRPSSLLGQAAALPQRTPSSPPISLLSSRRKFEAERGRVRGDRGRLRLHHRRGGFGGCLLANRLSADAGKRVLVLEAGGRDNWICFISRSVICSRSAIRVQTGVLRPSRSRASTGAASTIRAAR